MPRRTGRGSELWDFLLSDGNLGMAIDEVNESPFFGKAQAKFMYRVGPGDNGRAHPGAAANHHQWLCPEKAEGETAVGPQCAEVADHQRTGPVAGPIRSPRTYPSIAADPYAGDGPVLLREHPGPGDQARQGGRGAVDGKGPVGDEVRIFRRRVSLLRQLEAGGGHGPYAPALQGPAGAGPDMENRQGRRSDWGIPVPVVCKHGPATAGPAYPAERALRPLCAVHGQPDGHWAEQAEAEKATLPCGRMAERP